MVQLKQHYSNIVFVSRHTPGQGLGAFYTSQRVHADEHHFILNVTAVELTASMIRGLPDFRVGNPTGTRESQGCIPQKNNKRARRKIRAIFSMPLDLQPQ